MRTALVVFSLAASLPLALPAAAQTAASLSDEQARAIVPRADLSALTPEQKAEFLEVAGDIPTYAGCQSTLAACLAAGQTDPHAVREARLAALLIHDGFPTTQVIVGLEQYYRAFEVKERKAVDAKDCALYGPKAAPVTLVEFSDYQCPSCAAAYAPLHAFIDGAGGKAKLCAKHSPLPIHARSAIAAACAEYARSKGGNAKFWALSQRMFADQENLTDDRLQQFAAEVGLDGADMLKQAYQHRFDAQIERDKAQALAAEEGRLSTPTVFIDGRKFNLPLRREYLQMALEDEMEWQRHPGFGGAGQAGRGW